MVREIWLGTLLFALAMAGFQILFARVIPRFFKEFSEHILQVSFVRNIIQALLGTPIDSSLGPNALGSLAWAHPIVLTLVWANAIVVCTRMPAGEVDRGTIDVLLSLPVSRMGIYLSELVVWLVSGLVVLTMGLLGNLIGKWSVSHEFPSAAGGLLVVIANLYCVYIAVGGIACLVSSLSDRRGRAVGVVFSIVLGSFFLTFLAQFWAPAGAVSFLSILDYYRPLLIIRDSSWPVADMLVLFAVGAATWLAGAVVFARRDICTV